jgi:cytoskeletal protein RodZ
MKGLLKTTLFGAALAVAGAGFAQSATSPQKGDEDRTPVSSPSTQPSSTDTNSMSSSSNTGTTATGPTAPGTYTGTVKTIEAGRTIVITSADGKTQTFDISSSPTMDTSIATGKRVRVIQTVDASGRTVVTVEPYR